MDLRIALIFALSIGINLILGLNWLSNLTFN